MANLVAWLVRKDLRVFFADRSGALKAFVLPVLLASLIGVLFAPRPELGHVELLVADEDGGAIARAVVAALDREEAIDVLEVSLGEARRRLELAQSGVALWLPRGVSDALGPSRPEGVGAGRATLLYDPSRHIELELVNGLLQRAALLEAMDRLAAPRAAGLPLDVRREPVLAAGPGAGYNSYAHNFAGMLCMFLLFMAQDLARTLIAERQTGVLVRTRLFAPRPWVTLLATVMSTGLLGLGLTAAMFAVAIGVFGVELLGGVGAFVVVAVAYALFAGAFAALLAALARSDKELAAVGTTAILISSFVGGAWYPRFMMPEWLQAVSSVLPTTWATEGFAAATWRGLPFAHALVPALVLLAFAAGFVALARWRFRW